MQSQDIHYVHGDIHELKLSPVIYTGSLLGGKKQNEIQLESSEGEVSEEESSDEQEQKKDEQEQLQDLKEEIVQVGDTKTKRTTKIKRTKLSLPKKPETQIPIQDDKKNQNNNQNEFVLEDQASEEDSQDQGDLLDNQEDQSPIMESQIITKIKQNDQLQDEINKQQEELRKQEEQRKLNELKKQEEQRKQDELRKQDEFIRQQELRKQEEEKLHNKLKTLQINENEKSQKNLQKKKKESGLVFEDKHSDSDDEFQNEELQKIQENIQKRVSSRKPQKNEYVYKSSDEEDNSEDQTEENRKLFLPLLKEETKKQAKSFVLSNNNEESAISEDTSLVVKQKKDEVQEVEEPQTFEKGSKLETYLSGGLCCTIFICSSILWIILFRNLILKNREIYDLVYDIPTLQTYHNKYDNFFHQFDKNRDSVLLTKQLLGKDSPQTYKQSQVTVNSILTNLNAIREAVNDMNLIGEVLEEEKKSEHVEHNQRRLTKDSLNIEELNLLLNKVNEIQEKSELMIKMNNDLSQQKVQQLSELYNESITNLKKLYEESFSLVALYGDFYVMTN